MSMANCLAFFKFRKTSKVSGSFMLFGFPFSSIVKYPIGTRERKDRNARPKSTRFSCTIEIVQYNKWVMQRRTEFQMLIRTECIRTGLKCCPVPTLKVYEFVQRTTVHCTILFCARYPSVVTFPENERISEYRLECPSVDRASVVRTLIIYYYYVSRDSHRYQHMSR